MKKSFDPVRAAQYLARAYREINYYSAMGDTERVTVLEHRANGMIAMLSGIGVKAVSVDRSTWSNIYSLVHVGNVAAAV